MTDDRPADPVLVKRARIARLVELGKAGGYGLFCVSIVAFVVGFFAGFDGAVRSLFIVGIVVGSILLAPAIVFGYGIKAAEREERQTRT
jgi:hypothetical protein